MIPRRYLLALAAVVDVAIHARSRPVAAKALAARHGLAPRHLEPLLQDLVRTNILKGTRGPHGGYALARERRRISAADVVRALDRDEDDDAAAPNGARLLDIVIAPMIASAAEGFLSALDGVTIEDLCRHADERRIAGTDAAAETFHI